MYSDVWGGLPSKDFLTRLDPKLADLRDRLYEKALRGRPAGGHARRRSGRRSSASARASRSRWAASTRTTAPSAPASARARSSRSSAPRPATARSPRRRRRSQDVPGICGIVNGSIMPGYYGIEAGQSAVGDILKWWVEGVCQGDERAARAALRRGREARRRASPASLALDWNNGNRTILVDPRLTGLLVGQTLHTTRAEVYRALIEATAFGARAIIERMREYGVPIDRVVCCGGIAEKNDALHADLRRRDRPPDADRRLAADAGPRLGDLRPRSRPGRHAELRGGAGEDDRRSRRSASRRTRRRSASTTSSTASTASCTTASAASPGRRRTSRPS